MRPETPPVLSSKDSTSQQVDGAGSQRLQQGLWKGRCARHVSSWSGAEHVRSGRREQIGGWVRTRGGIFRCERQQHRTGPRWAGGTEPGRAVRGSPWDTKEREARREKGMTGESDSSPSMRSPANSGEQKTSGKRCSEHQQGGYTLLLSRRCQSSHHGGPTAVKERKRQMDPSGWGKRRIRNLLLRDG